jgi:hypothetical protein
MEINHGVNSTASGLDRVTTKTHPIKINAIPGNIPSGGFCPSHQIAKSELTGTSKKIMSETIAGETRLRAALNIEWPRICAPKTRPKRIHHSRPAKLDIGNPMSSAIGNAVMAHTK